MKIAVASDHAGFDLKTRITALLAEMGVSFHDFGSGPGETVDYVDHGVKAMESIVSGECDRAILFCGTGIGMGGWWPTSTKGIRATPCWSRFTAQVSRSHNDSNCLTLGGRTLSSEKPSRSSGCGSRRPLKAAGTRGGWPRSPKSKKETSSPEGDPTMTSLYDKILSLAGRVEQK